MKNSISLSTVCSYYSAATTHGLAEITESCLSLMEWSIEFVISDPQQAHSTSSFLNNASIDFMEKILDRPNVIIGNEMRLFLYLLKYMMESVSKSLQLKWESAQSGNDPSLQNNYSADLEFVESVAANFLESEDGKPFAKLFNMLKEKPLVEPITFHKSRNRLGKLFTEAVVNQVNLEQAGNDQWIHMLKIQRGLDHGPRKATTSEEVFAENCVRCALLLNKDNFHKFSQPSVRDLSHAKHLGYNFGIALKLRTHQKSNGRLSFRLQRGEIADNNQLLKHTILCKMQTVLITETMTAHQRFSSEIIEINLGSSAAHKVLEFPFDAATSTHLSHILTGIQVQFVNPL